MEMNGLEKSISLGGYGNTIVSCNVTTQAKKKLATKT